MIDVFCNASATQLYSNIAVGFLDRDKTRIGTRLAYIRVTSVHCSFARRGDFVYFDVDFDHVFVRVEFDIILFVAFRFAAITFLNKMQNLITNLENIRKSIGLWFTF